MLQFTMASIIKSALRGSHVTKMIKGLSVPRKYSSVIALDAASGLSDEQQATRELAVKFAQNELLPNMAKWDRQECLPSPALRTAASLGFGAIYCSDTFGGTGLCRLDASVIFEALAAGCVSTTAYLSIHNMCAWMVDTFGNDKQREQWIPTLATMDQFASYCLTEPNAGSDAASLSTKAVKKGDHYVVTGAKAFISYAGESDLYIVMCRTGDDGPKGISCLMITKDMKGVVFGAKEKKMGWNSQPTRMIHFEDVKVPISNRLGEEGQGFAIAMRGLNGGRVNIASCSLGAADASLKAVVDYAKSRKLFNSSLSNFQNTQFQLAEMATEIVSSRLMVRNAATALDTNHPNSVILCAMAKMQATQNCLQVIDKSLQLHGGYGYLKDYPIEQYYRDCRVHRILEGTNEIMKLIVSRDLL